MCRPICILLLMMLMLGLAGCQQSDNSVREGNLLESALDWERLSWKKHGVIELDNKIKFSGQTSYKLNANKKNDLRFVKNIKVYAGRFYRFSAMVRTRGVKGSIGANLSAEGTYNHSRQVLTGDQDWTHVEHVFRALKDDNVGFSIRLGYWNATATGAAWFDDVSLEELSEWSGAYEAIEKSPADIKFSSKPLRLFALLLFVPFLYSYLVILRQHSLTLKESDLINPVRQIPMFWVLLFVALITRLVAAGYMGFTPQLEHYKDWALFLADPLNIFKSDLSLNFELLSPIFLYWLSLVGYIIKSSMLETSVLFTVLIKLPGVVLELCLIYLLSVALSKQLPIKKFIWQVYFLVLNPAFIMLTAFWGQPIAIAVFFLCLSILMAHQSKVIWAGLALGSALSANLMSAIFIPVMGLLLISSMKWRDLCKILIFAGMTAALLCVPVWAGVLSGQQAPLATLLPVNAIPPSYSVWGLFGYDYLPFDQSLLWQVIIFCCLLFALLFLERRRTKLSDLANSKQSPYAFYYIVALLAATVMPFSQDLFLYLALVFCIPLLVHEIYFRSSFVIITALLFVKHSYLMSYLVVSRIHIPSETILPDMVLLVMFILLLIALQQYFQFFTGLSVRSRLFMQSFQEKWIAPAPKKDELFSLTKYDYLAVVMMSIFSLVLITYNIGETQYPKKGSTFSKVDSTFEVHWEKPITLTQVRVYTGANGIGIIGFERWSDEQWQPLWEKNGGRLRYTGKKQFYSTFRVLWRNLKGNLPIDRLRITVAPEDLDLNEIAFMGESGKLVKPYKIIKQEGGITLDPQSHPLFDEQDQILEKTGIQTRTYWDEVFYARSSYELINGIEPFEKTHPPLGKTLIAIGIRLFDMTPFGWRIVDALFVAILPILLFIGGRWITGKRIGAYLAAGLCIFELMPFIHGRWANIDSILVVFLTASLLSLYRWYMLGNGQFQRSNIKWFLIGSIFFGLAVSTKWSALFTAFAIFIMLVITKLLSLNNAVKQQRIMGNDAVAMYFRRDFFPSVGYWALGFLLIPAVIYYLSHFELLSVLPNSPSIWSLEGVRGFIDQQFFVWNYHSDRDDIIHTGSSMFFTWPIMWQPIFVHIPSGVPKEMHASLYIIGNPVIWWSGCVVMLGVTWIALKGKNHALVFLASLYFLQCLPWLLVTRTTFLYHYYPFLPLVFLGIAYVASRLNYQKIWAKAALGGYALLVIAGFIAYYPLATATTVTKDYVESLRILDTWPKP